MDPTHVLTSVLASEEDIAYLWLHSSILSWVDGGRNIEHIPEENPQDLFYHISNFAKYYDTCQTGKQREVTESTTSLSNT
ncbi:hypothetical protein HZH68_003992 [Vespula germanica]|uniref:Uncharacterized protein n=1 Tax=Vespula germanica TaxID=30212 RepID=A0A834KMS0_VESGE|nr:hypothetical protein HZH68_003992 [Vespula germanica]